VETLKTPYRSENVASLGSARCGITVALAADAGPRFEHRRAISPAKNSAYHRFLGAGRLNEPKAFLPFDFAQPFYNYPPPALMIRPPRVIRRRGTFVLFIAPFGLQMTNGERPFKEKLALQIAIRKIDSAFEACSRFDEKDKKILFEIIKNLLLQHIPHGPGGIPVPADEATHPFRELADTAPTVRLPPTQTLKRKPPKPIGFERTRRRLILERKSSN
jgi:hypothetical protein